MWKLPRITLPFTKRWTQRDKEVAQFVQHTTGYRVKDPAVYQLAFRHISRVKNGRASNAESNERLEFLGDAVLGSITAEYLFTRYAISDEGFLTELRSKIVNRSQLNDIATKLGLDNMLDYDAGGNWFNRTIFGNTFEAFIGAVYLDQGYERTRKFLVERVLRVHVNVDELSETDKNFKSQVMELAQKQKMGSVSYMLVGETADGPHRQFTVACKIGQEIFGFGTDMKKKFAEQKASEAAMAKLIKLVPQNGKAR